MLPYCQDCKQTDGRVKDTLLSILGRERLFLLIFAGILAGCSNLTSGFDGLPPIYVDATGSGKDSRAALDDAFRTAVLEAGGVLISSKMQLTNGSITKDEMSEFSAGYIFPMTLNERMRATSVSLLRLAP